MNNEPVAWMYRIKDTDNRWELTWNKPTTEELFDTEPLYTHPVKTLTNEEILCLWDWWSGESLSTDILDFADTYKRVLLGEEGLLEWHKEYVKKMNEQYPLEKAQEK